jgi:hypothetical protein
MPKQWAITYIGERESPPPELKVRGLRKAAMGVGQNLRIIGDLSSTYIAKLSLLVLIGAQILTNSEKRFFRKRDIARP